VENRGQKHRDGCWEVDQGQLLLGRGCLRRLEEYEDVEQGIWEETEWAKDMESEMLALWLAEEVAADNMDRHSV
jgi:hypothetical protein